MSIVLELLSRAALHSSLIERIISALTDYQEGRITEDDAKRELDRLDEEVLRIKQEHWAIVGVEPPDEGE